MQLLLEVDHSSGHTKHKTNGLNVELMNLKYGGKKPILRDSVMTENSVNMAAPDELILYGKIIK